jgi:hypothetical protein
MEVLLLNTSVHVKLRRHRAETDGAAVQLLCLLSMSMKPTKERSPLLPVTRSSRQPSTPFMLSLTTSIVQANTSGQTKVYVIRHLNLVVLSQPPRRILTVLALGFLETWEIIVIVTIPHADAQTMIPTSHQKTSAPLLLVADLLVTAPARQLISLEVAPTLSQVLRTTTLPPTVLKHQALPLTDPPASLLVSSRLTL